jgi:hypothetical protein
MWDLTSTKYVDCVFLLQLYYLLSFNVPAGWIVPGKVDEWIDGERREEKEKERKEEKMKEIFGVG